MRGKLLAVCLVGFLVGAVSAIATQTSWFGFTLSSKRNMTTGMALIGGSYELLDHNGKTITDKSYPGRYKLIYFGFTNCPDICPAGLQIITQALEQLGSKSARLKPLFITLDPQRDTPAKMADYVSSFHPSLVGLTGTKAQVAKVARAYRVYYTKAKNSGQPDEYSIDHSGYMYLMSPNGKYLKHFPHTVSVDRLAKALDEAIPTLSYWQRVQGVFAD